ncbi:MAG: primosomal protein N' [Clostridia bacterium]|nr:primosomal protein N' [Clostridia bacterium]
MLIAEIVLEQTAYSFDKPYSYAVPEELEKTLSCGCRVVVPFGKGNSHKQGVVLEMREGDDQTQYKQIERQIDETPIISEEMLCLCKWMREHCFCTYFDAIKAVLPTGISFTVREMFSKGEVPFDEKHQTLDEFFEKNPVVSEKELLDSFDFLNQKVLGQLVKEGKLVKTADAVRRMNDAKLKSIRLIVSENELSGFGLTPRQTEVAQSIADIGSASVKEIMYFTGASASVLNTLVKKGVAEFFDLEVYRSPIRKTKAQNTDSIVLTDEQNEAFERLDGLYSSDKGETALLYGVTGSGKTSVFLKLVDKVVSEGKGVIIMVPEIALTPQTAQIFGDRYGSRVALFHSAMSLGQRMDEFKRVSRGEATVAIGTRSAIFAPVKNLSLIIMDEEHEHTYKSEKSPRFHARDLAKFRAAYNKALLILASATPSLESYSLAKLGKYSLCTLKNRYGSAELPEVRTVDMRREILNGNHGALSTELKQAIDEALKNGKQAIVLLNRRGHNTYISCPSCGYVATCPNCSVSMTYHSANKRLMCHYCGYSESANKKCPSCSGADLRFMGIGTQRVEEELSVTFPDASILRLDADSTTTRDSFSKYLSDFAEGKYDIILGTQMVAKGLNFPNVTVVGVIGADSAANSSDYRSFERSFALLTQVFGRAGRGADKGVAIIQTTDPESNLITLAAGQDYESFYEGEIGVRRMMTYPPYCDIAQVIVQSSSKETAKEVSAEVFRQITEKIGTSYSDVKLRILGPSSAALQKVNNKYRFRLIIKVKNSRRFRELLREAINVKTDKNTSIWVDINPETII